MAVAGGGGGIAAGDWAAAGAAAFRVPALWLPVPGARGAGISSAAQRTQLSGCLRRDTDFRRSVAQVGASRCLFSILWV